MQLHGCPRVERARLRSLLMDTLIQVCVAGILLVLFVWLIQIVIV